MKNKAPMLDRVRAGIAFLNVRIKGWIKRIDLKDLDMSDGCNCILGQLDSDYNSHKEELKLSDRTANDLGFHEESNWDKLTRTWKREIKKRLR